MTPGSFSAVALGGNDVITDVPPGGGDGPDELFGDAGNDTLRAAGTDDILVGGEGNDNLFGNAGHDDMWGGAGNDNLVAGDGNDCSARCHAASRRDHEAVAGASARSPLDAAPPTASPSTVSLAAGTSLKISGNRSAKRSMRAAFRGVRSP